MFTVKNKTEKRETKHNKKKRKNEIFDVNIISKENLVKRNQKKN